MVENGVSGPSSLVYIQAKESYPKKAFVFDDLSVSVPFPELSGENVQFLGKSSDAVFAISNFRFCAIFQHSFVNIPLMLIESLEWKGKEFPEILVSCKNGQSFQLKFDSVDECNKWHERLKKSCQTPNRLEKLFAFAHYAWCLDSDSSLSRDDDFNSLHPRDTFNCDFLKEYKRMGFSKDPAWKITDINSKFEICSSYPKLHIVPSHVTDEKLKNIAKFRASQRFPSAVWRHNDNGAVIVRCSQPQVGWLYWRCEDDEIYLQTLGNLVESTKPAQNNEKLHVRRDSDDDYTSDVNTSLTNGHSEKSKENAENTICDGVDKKVLVVDCRSNYAAFANRAKGGGSECTEYYPNCKIQFMGLANIHSIRKSFQSLRELCCRQDEQSGWLTSLEATKWLSHISSLIKTALVVVKAVEQERQHVVVHCSDGWDRTSQVVALAELLLDPFYRTIKGFRVLLEREWLAFGHKFADRCGHGCQEDDDTNERCPVFLQFLDCVHQLLRQFPCNFEFNETFLLKLAHHTYSCLYGTFLCSTQQERLGANIKYRTCSVWSMLEAQSTSCKNFLYSAHERKVLYPEYQVRNILLWTSLYLSTPLIYFENSLSLNSSDTVLMMEQDFPTDSSRTEPESRLNVVRRNSDGDVKITSTDDNFVSSSGARDDSDLYMTKSLVCKSDTCTSPVKGLVANGSDRKSSEMVGDSCDDNTFDQNEMAKCKDRAEKGCENNSSDYNGKLKEDCYRFKHCENTVIGQNGITGKDDNGSETEDCEASALKRNTNLVESMTSSSSTVVHENNIKEVKGDKIENGELVSENCSEINRPVTKAINCRSNHRLNNFSEENQPPQHGLNGNIIRSHVSNVENSCRESGVSLKSPKEQSLNKLQKYLDADGLSLVVDPVQARLVKLERCYREKIEGLETQLQTQGCNCDLHQKVSIKQDMVSNEEAIFEGSNSLSSNAASDTCGSWEQVTGDEINPILWVPDHHAISCRSCDEQFSLTKRKHHCRNCGKVFCSSCCSDLAPVPSEQLYDPVRVCKTCFGKLHVNCNQDITVAAS